MAILMAHSGRHHSTNGGHSRRNPGSGQTMEHAEEPRAPEFLTIGNVTQDHAGDGWQLGGTAAYAALVAARLGRRAALLTRAHPLLDLGALLPGVDVVRLPSETTTVFEHAYLPSGRVQHVLARAASLAPDAVPQVLLTARTVLLGPVLDEVDPHIATSFPSALVGAAAQGWLRRTDEHGLVHDGQLGNLDLAAFAGRLSVLFLSDEDLGGAALPQSWLAQLPIVVVTSGSAGSRLFLDGSWWHIDAFPAREIDPTGAGDAFAAAFLVRYQETGDVAEAARFAAAVASFIVELPGIDSAPLLSQVLQRLEASPNIQLRAA